MEKISQESLDKALETLGLKKAENADQIAKDAELKKAEEKTAIEKADKEKVEAELAETLKKAEELQVKLGLKKAETAPVVEKKEEPVKEDKSTELIKGFEDKIVAIGTLFQKKNEENEELKKSISDISEFNARLAERLNMIEKQPVGQKSISGVKYLERFEKSGEAGDGMKKYSLSNPTDKTSLVNTLYKAVQEKGFGENGEPKDKILSKAMKTIEYGLWGTNPNETAIIDRMLKENHKIIVLN